MHSQPIEETFGSIDIETESHIFHIKLKVFFSLILQGFIYLFIGRKSKRTYMTDGVKRMIDQCSFERVYVLHNI